MTLALHRRDFLQLFAVALGAPATPKPATPTPVPARPSPTSTPQPQPTPARTPSPTTTRQPLPWLQALRPLTLWSGPDDQAEPLGTAALWDYFLLARPQVGGRLYVQVARS